MDISRNGFLKGNSIMGGTIMKKRVLSALFCTVIGASMIAGSAVTAMADGVELDVVTTFAGEDSNAKNYQDGISV